MTGALLVGVLPVEYFVRGHSLPGPSSAVDHLAVTGLMFVIMGFSTFCFTLLLHATGVKFGRSMSSSDDGDSRTTGRRGPALPMSFTESFVEESVHVLKTIDPSTIEACASVWPTFVNAAGVFLSSGVGGSAGHASHAVNDFRKLCGFEAYAPTDNVSELTARINDDGWDTVFSDWLDGSHLSELDGLLVFSVGGGDAERRVSGNLGVSHGVGTSS